ncbi:Rho GTPase-activating protein 7 [Bienertia sinuspersici]
MEGLSISKEKNIDGKREYGLFAHHRRSRSASDRKVDVSRIAEPHFVECTHNLLYDSPFSTRTNASQTPSNGQSVDSSASSSYHRASLEKDVHLLQSRLQQEKSVRIMLEKAIGRASSGLSPGHRHFASQSQTKELIAEIELLEEEVANREQHVLALYRNIFEQCVSQPSSVRNSGACSPVHTKNKTRKHPSIISSAFCSSKKFPFRALSSKSTSGKKDGKIRHSSFCTGKTDVCYEKPCSNPIKAPGKSPDRVKNSNVRTLKDYLHQCPNKLSEEMVKCMAAVYCWLCSAASEITGKSVVEITSMPIDKKKFSRASYAINGYRVLVEQLERVDVSHMETDAQAYLAYGIPHNSLRKLALFHKAAYNIGGIVVTANAIEHTIFCFRTPRIGGWIETILSTAFRKKSEEEKQLQSSQLSLPNSQSLVCFALCTGAFSDPALKVYTAANVRDELEQAKSEFLQTNISVKKSKKVFLPKMLERYSREASMGLDELLKWICENVDKKLQDSIQRCFNSKKASQIIEWLPYSSKFRYTFSEGLASKPWFV